MKFAAKKGKYSWRGAAHSLQSALAAHRKLALQEVFLSPHSVAGCKWTETTSAPRGNANLCSLGYITAAPASGRLVSGWFV